MTQPYPISPNDPVSPPPQPARTDEPDRYPIHRPIPEVPIHPEPATTPPEPNPRGD